MSNEKNLLYHIWLSQFCNYNFSAAHKLLEKFGSVEEVFKANKYSGALGKLIKLKNLLRSDTTLDTAKRILEACNKKSITTISLNNAEYPNRLREINDPPLVLYARGKLPDLNKMLGIAVVGSRHCTDDGKEAASRISKELAESGFVIVSGMAMGIDGAAHCAALSVGGTTLAVLAGGVDVIYPSEHTRLYYHIEQHGAVLSERPPQTVGRPSYYRQRNRLLVGLSAGVLIAEGEEKSGTSITAKLAYNANRDVFAIPGNPVNPLSSLPNSLIKDGAKVTANASDITEEYIEIYPECLDYGISIKGMPVTGNFKYLTVTENTVKDVKAPKTVKVSKTPADNPAAKKAVISQLSDDKLEEALANKGFSTQERKILKYMYQAYEAVLFDDIADDCEIESAALGSILIILQMKKAVLQSAGGQYKFNTEILE